MEKKVPVKKTTTRKAATPRKVAHQTADTAQEAAPVLVHETEAPKKGLGEGITALGRRKEASAHVHLSVAGKGTIHINGRTLQTYFPTFELQESIRAPLKVAGRDQTADVNAVVRGGGSRGQAEAVRLGIARALVKLDENLRKTLKGSSLLTRDPRVKERKKYGLKKARKAPQWAKR